MSERWHYDDEFVTSILRDVYSKVTPNPPDVLISILVRKLGRPDPDIRDYFQAKDGKHNVAKALMEKEVNNAQATAEIKLRPHLVQKYGTEHIWTAKEFSSMVDHYIRMRQVLPSRNRTASAPSRHAGHHPLNQHDIGSRESTNALWSAVEEPWNGFQSTTSQSLLETRHTEPASNMHRSVNGRRRDATQTNRTYSRNEAQLMMHHLDPHSEPPHHSVPSSLSRYSQYRDDNGITNRGDVLGIAHPHPSDSRLSDSGFPPAPQVPTSHGFFHRWHFSPHTKKTRRQEHTEIIERHANSSTQQHDQPPRHKRHNTPLNFLFPR